MLTQAQAKARADLYRREAADLRRAVELIQEDGLRRQLLAIAQEYEDIAADIERQLARAQQNQGPEPRNRAGAVIPEAGRSLTGGSSQSGLFFRPSGRWQG